MRGKAKNLNDVDKLKWNPRGSSVQRFWDSVQPGLNLRVYPSPGNKRETGRKVFAVRFTEEGKQRIKKLGDWGELSVDDARAQAAEIRRKVKDGLTAEVSEQLSIGQLFDKITRDRFYPFHQTSKVYQYNTEYRFKKYITFKNVPVEEVTAEHWLDAIDYHLSEKRYGTAEALMTLAGAFYKNAQAHKDYRLLKNPINGIHIHIPKADPKAPLTPAELGEFKHDPVHPVHSAITRILILTGQRISEVLRMCWEDIEDGVWIVGRKGDMKNKKSAHHLPLTQGILDAIEPMKEYGSEWVFAGQDRHITRVPYVRILKMTNPSVSPHTFRHTFATLGTDQAGIEPYNVKLVLHHSFGDVTHGVYMHGQQLDRKTEALEQWEKYVGEL